MIKIKNLESLKIGTKVHYIDEKLILHECEIIKIEHISNELTVCALGIKIGNNDHVISQLPLPIQKNLYYTKEVAIIKIFEILEKIGKKYRKELEKILYSKTYKEKNG